jgi:hypothetical protein
MALIKSLFVRLGLKTDAFVKGAKKASKSSKSLRGEMKRLRKTTQLLAGLSVARAAFGVLSRGFRAVKSVVIDTTRAYDVQIQAEAKLAAVLKATGNAAGFSAKQLKARAGVLQSQTLFGDETIISAQAKLATFRNISGDAFKRATVAVLDMSTVLETDLKSSAIQLGKALNDPIAGITALGRSGVQLTDVQKKMIRTFIDQGQILKAQNIILKELEGEFGGAARAAAAASSGLEQMQNSLGDVAEDVGEVLAPAVKQFAEWVKNNTPTAVPTVENVGKIFDSSGQILGEAVLAVFDAARFASFLPGGPTQGFGGKLLDFSIESRQQTSSPAIDMDALRKSRNEPKAQGRQGPTPLQIKDATKIFEQTRTAEERFAEQQRELNGLWRSGALDLDTYTRALERARSVTKQGAGFGILGQAISIAGLAFQAPQTKQPVVQPKPFDLNKGSVFGLMLEVLQGMREDGAFGGAI